MYIFIDRLAVRITAIISAVVWPIVFNTKRWLFKPLSYENFCDLPIWNVYFCCFTYNAKTLKTSFRMPHDILFQLRFFYFYFIFCGIWRQTVILVVVFCLTAWLVNINNSRTAVFNMLTTRNSCGKICFFNQHYQPGKIISQVLAWWLNI